MHRANHHALPEVSCAPTERTPASNAPAPATRRGALTLRAILDALSWLGELRAMPYVALEPRARHNERRSGDN